MHRWCIVRASPSTRTAPRHTYGRAVFPSTAQFSAATLHSPQHARRRQHTTPKGGRHLEQDTHPVHVVQVRLAAFLHRRRRRRPSRGCPPSLKGVAEERPPRIVIPHWQPENSVWDEGALCSSARSEKIGLRVGQGVHRKCKPRSRCQIEKERLRGSGG